MKKRSYFFETPSGSAYHRFSKENIPTEAMYKELFESITFKLNVEDTATETQQGLVKVTTDAKAKTRTSESSGAMLAVVQPHQLPLMVGTAGTEAGTIATALEEVDGMKLTPVLDATTKRMNFKIEWDPILINAGVETSPDIDADKAFNVADKIIFLDYSDGNKPKPCNISEVLTAANALWSLSGTTLEPATANNNVDIGTGYFVGSALTLDNTSDRQVRMDVDATAVGTKASKLTIRSTDANSIGGGDLVLRAGSSSAASAGGDAHLYGGGTSGGTEGNTLIGYTEGAVAVGKVGILADADATYDLKIGGDTWIDGGLKLSSPSVAASTYILGITSGDLLTIRTKNQVNDFLFGTAAKGDLLYFDGTDWALLSLPASDAYFKMDFATQTPEWDTALTSADKYVAVDATANAGYLYDGGVGVLRFGDGLGVVDSGDYITVSPKSSTFDTVDITTSSSGSELKGGAYASGFQNADASVDKNFQLDRYVAGFQQSGWRELHEDAEFNNTAASTSRISMLVDWTEVIHIGQPVKFKLTSGATIYYAIIADVTATYIDIAGAPLTTGASDIDNLWIGHPSKVKTASVIMNVAAYNNGAGVATAAIETNLNATNGYRWMYGDAYCVHFSAIHGGDDSTVQPFVNVRTGALTADYVSTSNANSGILVGTTENETVVDIETSKYDIFRDEYFEIKVDVNGGTGDADYLSVFITFVCP